MEIKNPEDLVNGEEEIGALNRSNNYTCSFCKRGFSNAQALGGHMNVHRRDRARAAAAAAAESIQEEIPTTKAAINSIDQLLKSSDDLDEEDDDKGSSSVPKRPWILTAEADRRRLIEHDHPRKKDHAAAGVNVNMKLPILQLSLSCIDPIINDSSCIDRSDHDDKLISSLSSTTEDDVDLELRLGIDSESTSRDHHRVIRSD